MITYKRVIEHINYFSFLVLLCAMPFPWQFIRFFGLVWAVTWLLELRFIDRANLQLTKERVFVAIGFGVWFLWSILSVLWAENKSLSWTFIQRDYYILLIPLVMLFGVNDLYDWKKCIKTLVIACAISIGVYLFAHYWLLNIARAYDKHVTSRVDIDWLHLNDFTRDMKHRLHYTAWLCLAIIGINSLFVSCRTNLKETIWYVLAIVLFLAGIYWTGSRAAIVNLAFIGIFAALWEWTRRQQRPAWQKAIAGGLIAILLAGGAVALFKLHPRNHGVSVQEFLTLQEGSQPTFEPRVAIWNAALETPEDYSLYGVGVGNSYDYLQQKYIAHGWEAYYTYRYSTHSQLLATWIELGLAAMVLWILFWLCMPFFFRGEARYWVSCICAICLVNMATDLFLGGVEGIVFVIVAFVLLAVLTRPLPPVMRPQP